MFKRVCVFILTAAIVLGCILPSFASGNDVMVDRNTKSTDQFMVTVTRPDGNESIYKKSYVICGVSENANVEDIRIKLLIYDEELGKYKDFKNTDNESSWDLGKYGIFIKEVQLPKEGENKIRIVAYRKSQADELKLGTNLQLNNFTITVLDEGIKDKIKNGIDSFTQLISKIFNKS